MFVYEGHRVNCTVRSLLTLFLTVTFIPILTCPRGDDQGECLDPGLPSAPTTFVPSEMWIVADHRPQTDHSVLRVGVFVRAHCFLGDVRRITL